MFFFINSQNNPNRCNFASVNIVAGWNVEFVCVHDANLKNFSFVGQAKVSLLLLLIYLLKHDFFFN